MNVLLVLNIDKVTTLRVLVTVTEKKLKEKVISLLQKNRGKEAFDLLKSKAEVRAYLPKGSKLAVNPQVTLIEDLL